MKEVEVIKIGEILGNLNTMEFSPIGKGGIRPIVIIMTNGGDIVDYYLDIFLKNMKDELEENGVGIQKTSGGIISATPRMSDILAGKVPTGKGIKGIEDSEPVVGEVYQLVDGWHTSRVCRIIEDCVLVTMNSVYAIHSTQTFREKKLKDLGI